MYSGPVLGYDKGEFFQERSMTVKWSISRATDGNILQGEVIGLKDGLRLSPESICHRLQALKTAGLFAEIPEWSWDAGENDGRTTGPCLRMRVTLPLHESENRLDLLPLILISEALSTNTGAVFASLVRYGPIGVPLEEINLDERKSSPDEEVSFAHPGLKTGIVNYHSGHPGLDFEVLAGFMDGRALKREILSGMASDLLLMDHISGFSIPGPFSSSCVNVTMTSDQKDTLPWILFSRLWVTALLTIYSA